MNTSTPASGPEPARTADVHRLLDGRVAEVRRRRYAVRVRDAHLGHPTVSELATFHATLGAAVREDTLSGATVHRRLPPVVRAVPWVVGLLDVVILFSFCADVFDVSATDPLGTPAAAAAAFFLAVLGGGVGFAFLSLTGDRLRDYRSRLGEVQWRSLGGTTWSMLATAVVLGAVLALLMRARVTAEIAAAGDGSADTAAVLGAVFAVLSAVANLTVVAVHALDGSSAARDLDRSGRLLRRYETGAPEVLPTRIEGDVTDPGTDHGSGRVLPVPRAG